MYITDAQHHLYLPDTPDRPWPEEFRGTNADQPKFTPDMLLPLMEEAGVARAVIVPLMAAGNDNGPCLRWTEEYPRRFAVVGRFDLLAPGGEQRIEHWLDHPGMAGLRMAGGPRWGDWLDLDAYGWLWAAAERLGIPVMAYPTGERIRQMHAVFERYPDVRVIIDHFGTTGIDHAPDSDPWAFAPDVLALAKYPNCWAKLSALPLTTNEPWPYPSLMPHIRRAYDAFGPARLAWGSDGSRYRRSSYQESVDHLLNGVDFLTADDKEQIMGKTIASFLGWPET